jgi:lipopolysaccharide/colanic/teichoic acid biosynthesis glycosyltransferase
MADAGASAPVGPGLPRLVEVFLSFGGLVVATPVIALAGIVLALSSGFPVFFRQTRVGRNARPFTLVKLRTMRVARSGLKVTASDDARVTRVGRFLRRSKLDELPELWNILKGEMSFVGPRPEVPQYVDPQSPAWKEVLRARPGLTDPITLRFRNEELLMAAVEGDRDAFYRETLQPLKLEGYRDYLRRRSWRTDIGVLFETVVAVLWPARSGSAGPSDLRGNPRPGS